MGDRNASTLKVASFNVRISSATDGQTSENWLGGINEVLIKNVIHHEMNFCVKETLEQIMFGSDSVDNGGDPHRITLEKTAQNIGGDNEEFDQEEFLMEEDLPSSSKDVIRDPLGEKMFFPDNIKHPRSAELCPLEHVAKCIKK
ncbi:hypothetical protein NDU88_007968 [Pleurodeles waltl]|uniref:Uncharacterized protein n=1 Tax=Pleurodeles waltl TaxID=8319 RepID=A0AAV7NUK4_PLEWA|nr:hypothetical protein NDU88_007968 [Pleurodeles waltl]